MSATTTPLPKTGLLLLFLLAFALRLGGLSHDLHHGAVYHPDTPKQVRAVEQYLRGDWLVLYDNPDYDGYPFFNSMLVAGITRVVMTVQSVWLQHTGAWTEPVSPPRTTTLFWIMRTWNAFLSALAVVFCFLVANRFSRGAAWAAAALLLVSPMDLNAARFAANDTASAFFALVALWFGLRIAEQGRYRDLIGGALCVGAAFSSKYHGAMGVLPVLIGLFLYVREQDGLWSASSLKRWAVLACFGLIGVALTSPALLIYPSRGFKDIIGFFEHTANFGLSREFRELPLPQRLWLGWTANLPVLIQLISLPVALAALAGLWHVKRDPRWWLVLSVPLVHLIIGLAGKPSLHTAHHLPALAYTFIAGALFLFYHPHRIQLSSLHKVVALLATCWAFIHLTPMTHAEIFFGKHNDTRRIVSQWARHATPEDLLWNTGRYTFSMPVPDEPLPVVPVVRSGDKPDWPDRYTHWFTFTLEDTRLSIFRNRAVHVHVGENDWLTPPVTSPYVMPLPLDNGDNLIALDLPWPGRTPWVRDVHRGAPVRAVAATDNPLPRAWIAVRTLNNPAELTVSFGGKRERLRLEAGSFELIEIEAPRRVRWLRNPRAFYRWKVETHWGQARVFLFHDGAQAGLWAFQQGDRLTARRLLVNETTRHPLYALASRVAQGEFDEEGQRILEQARDSDSAWRALFGAVPDWFDHIPYITWTAADWLPVRDDEETLLHWLSPILHLEPGLYHFDHAHVPWTLEDPCGQVHGRINHITELNLPAPARAWRIRLEPVDTPPETTSIRPDTRAMLQQWLDWNDNPDTRPRSAEPQPLPAPLVRFAGGITLHEVNIDTREAWPGGALRLNLRWQLPDRIRRPGRHAVWLHLLNEQGKTVVQGDHTLWQALNPACDRVIQLPDTLAPGTYELRAGLWIPPQRRRLNVTDSDLPSRRRYVTLDTITVNPAPAP